MNDINTLIAQVKSLARRAGATYQASSDASDVYEAYLFALAVTKATEGGARVHYEDAHGSRVKDLVLRTSPGQIYCPGRLYTHAVIEFDGAPALEVHLGVYVKGRSGENHECDIVILPAEEAARSRRQRIAPRGSRCLLAIEAKYYLSGLGRGLARNALGLKMELNPKNSLFVANTTSPGVLKVLNANRHPCEPLVVPSDPQRVENMSHHVRQAFRSHIERYTGSTVI